MATSTLARIVCMILLLLITPSVTCVSFRVYPKGRGHRVQVSFATADRAASGVKTGYGPVVDEARAHAQVEHLKVLAGQIVQPAEVIYNESLEQIRAEVSDFEGLPLTKYLAHLASQEGLGKGHNRGTGHVSVVTAARLVGVTRHSEKGRLSSWHAKIADGDTYHMGSFKIVDPDNPERVAQAAAQAAERVDRARFCVQGPDMLRGPSVNDALRDYSAEQDYFNRFGGSNNQKSKKEQYGDAKLFLETGCLPDLSGASEAGSKKNDKKKRKKKEKRAASPVNKTRNTKITSAKGRSRSSRS